MIFYELIADDRAGQGDAGRLRGAGFAVIYGVALLGEDFSVATATGLVLIIGGSWLAAEGRVYRTRRQLAARGVDVAAAREPDRGGHAALGQRGRGRRRSPPGSSPRSRRRWGCRGSG